MREGWKLKKWNTVLEIRSGRNQKDVENPEGEYPILGSAGKIMGYADEYICERGTTIIGRKGTIDNPMYIETKFWNVDTAFGLHALIGLDKRFLFYFCRSYDFTKNDKGSGRPSLVKTDLQQILMPIPPLPEQQQIVAILDKAFAAIDQAKANIERNIENAKELFQSKLNEIFSQKGEGWEEKKLPEVVTDNCKLSYGIVQPGEEYPNGLPVIRPTDMKQMFVDFQNLKRINPEKAKSYKRTELSGDELLLCVRGETGGVALLTKEFEGANVTRGIVPITFNKDVLLKFGYYQFMSPYISKQIKEKTYGAALMQINIKDIKKLTIKITSIANQKEIVELLDSLNQNTCKILSLFNEKFLILEELKKSILQKAFSGELTANDAIIEDIPLAAEPAMDYQTQQPYKG